MKNVWMTDFSIKMYHVLFEENSLIDNFVLSINLFFKMLQKDGESPDGAL